MSATDFDRLPRFAHLVPFKLEELGGSLDAILPAEGAPAPAEAAEVIGLISVDGISSALLMPLDLLEPLDFKLEADLATLSDDELLAPLLVAPEPSWTTEQLLRCVERNEGEFLLRTSAGVEAALVRVSRGGQLLAADGLRFYNGRQAYPIAEVALDLPDFLEQMVCASTQTEIEVDDGEEPVVLLASSDRFVARADHHRAFGETIPASFLNVEAMLAEHTVHASVDEAAVLMPYLLELARTGRPVVIGHHKHPLAVLFVPLP